MSHMNTQLETDEREMLRKLVRAAVVAYSDKVSELDDLQDDAANLAEHLEERRLTLKTMTHWKLVEYKLLKMGLIIP